MTSTGRNKVDFADWMRDIERRITAQERRPQHVHGLLGPGIGPHATRLVDWNDDAAAFNGYFFSDPGSVNSPDPTRSWAGTVVADDTGRGFQRVINFTSTDPQLAAAWPGISRVRSFTTVSGTLRTYSAWQPENPATSLAAPTTVTISTTSNSTLMAILLPVFNPAETYLMTAVLDCQHLTTTAVATLQIDTLAGGTVVVTNVWNPQALNLRQPITLSSVVTGLSPGTVGFSYRARLDATPDSYRMNASGSSMSVVRLS